ncbi:unnamed protein product [Cochlearia groenlandica]
MGRSPCCEKEHMNKGAWTKDEDHLLLHYIRTHGEGCWRSLPRAAGLQRCGKSCRLRWMNYLRPDLKRGNFTDQEDELIIKLHSLLGNKWSLIAGRLQGRTDNEIKNYWNTHIKRKLISRGIDPNTHRPINESKTTPSPIQTGIAQFDLTGSVKPEPLVREEVNDYASSETTSEKDVKTKSYDDEEEEDWVINLELSVGPATSYNKNESTRKTSVDSAESTRRWGTELCLCCRIGLRNESCRYCRISDVRTVR